MREYSPGHLDGQGHQSLYTPEAKELARLTDPEDRTFFRDLAPVVDELNRLTEEHDALQKALGEKNYEIQTYQLNIKKANEQLDEANKLLRLDERDELIGDLKERLDESRALIVDLKECVHSDCEFIEDHYGPTGMCDHRILLAKSPADALAGYRAKVRGEALEEAAKIVELSYECENNQGTYFKKTNGHYTLAAKIRALAREAGEDKPTK